MISANGGLPAHRYTPQVTQGWPQGSEQASTMLLSCIFVSLSFSFVSVVMEGTQGQDRSTPVLFPSFWAADKPLGRGVKPVGIQCAIFTIFVVSQRIQRLLI